MRFPQIESNNMFRYAALLFALAAITSFSTVPLAAQGGDNASSVSLEQCRNGGTPATADPCDESGGGGDGWVNGNTGDSQAHWQETQYVPYRMLFSGLPGDGVTIHTVVIGYDILKSGVHAIDYLGTYDITETVAMGNNPCDGVAGAHCSSYPAGSSTTLIPSDQALMNTFPAPRPTMPLTGVMTMWGGTLSGCTYTTYGGGEERGLACTFTASVSNPVLAWGGHIAWQGEWGQGRSAGNISGAPYHMRLIDFDGSGGSMDRSLSAAAVTIPAKLTIIKDALVPTGTTSPAIFDFTADAEFGLTAFDLADNGVLGDNQQDSAPIGLFGATNSVLVTEVRELGWDLLSIGCTGNTIAPVVSILNSGGVSGSVNITILEGQTITCTFTNTQLAPSSASAIVGGRVLTASGQGISGSVVSITNASTGQSFSRVTNSFGYYTFTDLAVGEFYVMTVSNKRHQFSNATISFTLNDDSLDIDFVADPQL